MGTSSTMVAGQQQHHHEQPESMQIVERCGPRWIGHQPVADLSSQDQGSERGDQCERRRPRQLRCVCKTTTATPDRSASTPYFGEMVTTASTTSTIAASDQRTAACHRLDGPVRHGSRRRAHLRRWPCRARSAPRRPRRPSAASDHADPHRSLRRPRHRHGHRRRRGRQPPAVEPAGDLPRRAEIGPPTVAFQPSL